MEIKDLIAEEVKQDTICKEIVYRADVQHCQTQRGVLFSVRLNKMKSLSCHGCEHCSISEDWLSEIDSKIWPIIDIETAEHGKLYTIGITNISRDWETNSVDSWDLKLFPYNIK